MASQETVAENLLKLQLDFLRRALGALDSQQAMQLLLDKTRDTASNPEFLRQIQRSG